MPTFYELFGECAERWPDNVALEIQRRDRAREHNIRRSTAHGGEHWPLADREWISARRSDRDSGRQSSALDHCLSWHYRSGMCGCSDGHGVSCGSGCETSQRQWRSLVFCDVRHVALAQKAVEEVSVRILLMDSAELRSAGQPGRLPLRKLISTASLRQGREPLSL